MKKAFYCSNLVYYASSLHRDTDETVISVESLPVTDDGLLIYGEFNIQWQVIGGEMTPRLLAFDDSWKVLSLVPELIQAMAAVDGKSCSQEDFSNILLSLGFKDITAYEDPAKIDDLSRKRNSLMLAYIALNKEAEKIGDEIDAITEE